MSAKKKVQAEKDMIYWNVDEHFICNKTLIHRAEQHQGWSLYNQDP